MGLARVWSTGVVPPQEILRYASEQGTTLSTSYKSEVVRIGDWVVKRSRLNKGAGPLRLTLDRKRYRRGYEAGLLLPRFGIKVPEVAGFVEWGGGGPIWRNALVMRNLKDYQSIRDHALRLRSASDDTAREFLRSLADSIIRLRDARVYHSDLAYKNVLTLDGEAFYFVDLDSVCCEHEQTVDERLRNAVQLIDSFSDVWRLEILRELVHRLDVDESAVWSRLEARIAKRCAFQAAVLEVGEGARGEP